MVDLIPIKKLYQYVSLQRQDLPEGRRYIYGEQKLPSVTTILSATKKDKGALDAWVARVGQEEADRIKNEASRVGTYLHELIERMVAYRHLPRPTNWDMCKGYELGYKIINTYFQHVSEIWGSEVSLYYPEKYAGTTDLVGVYRDKPAIIDFYADWCGPCQTLMPTVEKISREFQDDIEVRKVNVDQNSELAAKFGVRSIPSLFFIKEEEVLDRTVGLITTNTL